MAKSIKNKKQPLVMKKYIANVRQSSSTAAPVPTVFESTLSGAVAWTRSSVGDYRGNLTGEFLDNRVYIPPFGDFSGKGNVLLPLFDYDTNTICGYYTFYWRNEDEIGFLTKDINFQPADLFDLIGETDLSLPEIRVYP